MRLERDVRNIIGMKQQQTYMVPECSSLVWDVKVVQERVACNNGTLAELSHICEQLPEHYEQGLNVRDEDGTISPVCSLLE